MIGGGRIVVGVDVGSTKTCAVIAESGPATNGSTAPLTVHGVGLVESEGMSGATVTNLEAATASIRSAVQEAELMAGKEVESAYVGVAGTHVSVSTSRGVVAIGGAEVGPKDVQRVEEVGRAIVLGRDAELIHALCQDYTVDGRSGIEDPLGMAATRLESEVCIVTASTAVCTDLRKAVDRAGYRPAELVVEPLASSLAVLGDQEREAGVVLIEIGGANTDVIAFEGRRIHYLRSLPWGASSVNKDIAKGLGVPEDEALRLKREHGIALRSMVGASEHVEVSGPASTGRDPGTGIRGAGRSGTAGPSRVRRRADRWRSFTSRHRGAGQIRVQSPGKARRTGCASYRHSGRAETTGVFGRSGVGVVRKHEVEERTLAHGVARALPIRRVVERLFLVREA
jgi:cell division protein FtsA